MDIAIDFDGCISKYEGYKGKKIFGEVIPGTKETFERLRKQGHTIIINTNRIEILEVKEYLEYHGIPFDYINHNPKNVTWWLNPTKVRADIYIDDRGLKFEGDWDKTLVEVDNFKEWWR